MVVGYDILAQACAVIDCTVDTIPVGIKLYPTTNNFYASGLSWLTNPDLLPSGIVYYLFKGSETTVDCKGFVVGIQSMAWQKDVFIVNNVINLQIIGFVCRDVTHVLDYDDAVIDLLAESGGSGAQADWTETDSTSESYIKNKPINTNNTGFQWGTRTTASGNYASAFGSTNHATGNSSACIGGISSTASGNYSFASGSLNTASAESAVAFGNSNTMNVSGGFVCGRYGTKTDNSGRTNKPVIFKVGTGTSDSVRADALEIDTDNNVILHQNAKLYIGNTSINETQLQALLNLLS
jgi:hypothetical protein